MHKKSLPSHHNWFLWSQHLIKWPILQDLNMLSHFLLCILISVQFNNFLKYNLWRMSTTIKYNLSRMSTTLKYNPWRMSTTLKYNLWRMGTTLKYNLWRMSTTLIMIKLLNWTEIKIQSKKWESMFKSCRIGHLIKCWLHRGKKVKSFTSEQI
jgi:hypothetical protein